MNYPHHSDSFDKPELAPVWEFNHVPYKEKWSLTDRPGYFRIYAQHAKGFYWARNSLTQKVTGPYSTGTVLLDLSGLKEGDFGRNGIMEEMCINLESERRTTAFGLEMRKGNRNAGRDDCG